MICNGKQYAENTVFEEENAVICESGMHFCKEPLDVLDYYPLVDDNGEISEFAEVEALDEIQTDDERKFCAKKLKIGAKINFAQLVQASVNFSIEKAEYADEKKGNNKNFALIGSVGDFVQIGSAGLCARIGSVGRFANIGSAGLCARIGSAGKFANIGSAGDFVQIGSVGRFANIGSAGDFVQIGSAGDRARIGSVGKYAVICCAGKDSRVKAKIGSWITLSEWKFDETKKRYIPVCVKTERVDGKKIKEDTFYMLKNGEFVEVQ